MANELTIKEKGLVSLVADRGLGDIIKPLIKEIHLFDTYVAGTAYIEDETVFKELNEGYELTLQREDNRYDDKAVLVLNAKGAKLGYVPRKDNTIFARLMDAGKLLKGKVTKVEHKGSIIQISMGIYLVDF